MSRIRTILSSSKAVLAYRIILAVAVLALVLDATKTAQVLTFYDVEFGSQFWFVCVLKIVSAAVSVICMSYMNRGWVWSVWVWACAVLGIALAGILIGLDNEFLVRWDVALPWVVLVLSAALGARFATPWRRIS